MRPGQKCHRVILAYDTLPDLLKKMAVALAEALNLGTTATRLGYLADTLGTADYIRDKFKGMYKRRRKSYGTVSRKRRRVVRRRKRHVYRKRRYIGHPVGTSIAKRNERRNFTTEATRTLYQINLTNITKSIDNNISERQRDIVNLRGFRLCFDFANISAFPVHVNWVVVYDKRDSDGLQTIDLEDFFRGNGDQRALDWDNTLTSQQFTRSGLNADRFVVLRRKRFLLNADGDATGIYSNPSRTNFRTMKVWVPLKRQLRYEDDVCQTPIKVMYWFDQWQSGSGTTPVAGVMRTMSMCTTYFREPRT